MAAWIAEAETPLFVSQMARCLEVLQDGFLDDTGVQAVLS